MMQLYNVRHISVDRIVSNYEQKAAVAVA